MKLPRRLTATAGVALVLLGVAGTAQAALTAGSSYKPVQRTNIDRPVPAGSTLLPNGRLVSPAGRTYDLGDFPLGVAISPDGVLAVATGVGQGEGRNQDNFQKLCLDGQKKSTCSVPTDFGGPVGSPDEALFVTNLDTGKVTTIRSPQTRCNPQQDPKDATLNCFELGVVFSPDGSHVYAVGGGNDALYDFPVDLATHTVAAAPAKVTYLQEINSAPGGSGTYQSPNPGTQATRTKGLAITPDGTTLLVTKEQAGVLDLVNAADLGFLQEVSFGPLNPTGANGSVSYPYQVVSSPDGTKAYVTLQGTGQLATVPLNSVAGRVTAGVPVQSPTGNHPTGLAVSPSGGTVLVTNAGDDTVSVFPTTAGIPGVGAREVVKAVPGSADGSIPNAVAFTGEDTAYVALAGDNAVATLTRGATGFGVTGLLPTGWYPTSVTVRPGTGQLLALSAKGLGARYTPNGGYPAPSAGGPQALLPYYYDANNIPGLLTLVTPSDQTSQVRGNIAFAGSVAGPVRGAIPAGDDTAGQSPIKHVVYIVRENRTFDQVLGDLATTRNDVDADPSLEQLGAATPNAHAIVNRYASSDSFFSSGEASIQGHYWTTSANVADYTEKAYRQYYSDRKHSSDSVGTNVSAPRACSIFQAAQAKSLTTPGFTYKDYGDPVGVFNPSLAPGASVPGQGPTPAGSDPAGTLGSDGCGAVPAANADLTNFGNFLGTKDTDSATRFLADNGLTTAGDAAPGSAAALKNFSYLELPLDHTTGFTAQGPTNIAGLTPRAQVADNDAAVGMVLQSLSQSSVWDSTAVFVVEDDSQDGPDHVDGHRNVLLVASPYARQRSANDCYGGYVGHTHYDQASVLRTMELMLGLPSLSAFDQQAAPLYELFQDKTSAAQLTAADLAPYTATAAPFVAEKVGDPSAGTPAQQARLQEQSSRLDLSGIDRAGPGLETLLHDSLTLGEDAARPEQLTRSQASAGELEQSGDAVATDAARAQQARQAAAQAPAAAAVDCSPTVVAAQPGIEVPESRWAVLLPLLAVGLGAGVLVRRRRA